MRQSRNRENVIETRAFGFVIRECSRNIRVARLSDKQQRTRGNSVFDGGSRRIGSVYLERGEIIEPILEIRDEDCVH